MLHDSECELVPKGTVDPRIYFRETCQCASRAYARDPYVPEREPDEWAHASNLTRGEVPWQP